MAIVGSKSGNLTEADEVFNTKFDVEIEKLPYIGVRSSTDKEIEYYHKFAHEQIVF